VVRYLLFAALLLAAPAAAQWREASSRHFVVYSQEDEKDLRAYAEKLERFDSAMRRLNGVPDHPLGPANRLTVYVVPTIASVQRLARSDNVAGFYVGHAIGPVAVAPRKVEDGYRIDPQTVLLHEYAHHFMFQNFAEAFPAWLSEGFAEFSGTARFEKDGAVGFGAAPLERAEGLMSWDALMVEELLGTNPRRLQGAELDSLYGRGWLLTHFLKLTRSRQGQLGAYVAALNTGRSSLEAGRSAFGDLKQLNKELATYVLQRKLPYIRVEAAGIQVGPVAVRELTAGEGAVMELRMISRIGVTAERAKELVPQMRRAAAPFGDDAAVQVALAEAEFDAGELDRAETAADRALAADPKQKDAMIYKGRVKLVRAAGSTDQEVWKEARRWLIAANRVDSDDPEPLMLFYESYLAQRDRPPAPAVAALIRASDLAPQDHDLRLSVARQHLLDGKAAEAKTALAPIASAAHGGTRSDFAAAILAKLEEKGTTAATEEWERLTKTASEKPAA
jgi:tetratricopeptide (TPR) repeat protein